MPTLLNPIFPPLINALPVADHSIAVDAAFWQPKFAAAGVTELWGQIFEGLPSIRISRHRLLEFEYATPEQKCAEILLWGYPTNMRGIVSRLLPHLTTLAEQAASNAPWPAYFVAFPTRIGISTITKLAHFHARIFDGLQALILDSRLIENTAKWEEVNLDGLCYANARARYLEYLQVMHATAANPALACTPEQLEFFLFALGDSF